MPERRTEAAAAADAEVAVAGADVEAAADEARRMTQQLRQKAQPLHSLSG